MQNEVSAGAVVYRDTPEGRKYLLLHYNRTQHYWDFPKGKVEQGESHIEAAERECHEETGLRKLQFKDGFNEMISYWFMAGGQRINKQVFFFLAEALDDNVKISDEHIGFVWLPFDKTLARVSFKNSKDVLQKVETFLEE